MAKVVQLTSGRTGKIFKIRNFDTFTVDLDMPVTSFKLPEQDSSKTQLIKIEGNFKTFTISWLLADDGGDVSASDSIIDVDAQFDYLLTQFESIGIADSADNLTIVSASPAFSKNGKIVKILITKDAMEPENFRATVTLYEGESVVTAED